jgi:hypothetical protein
LTQTDQPREYLLRLGTGYMAPNVLRAATQLKLLDAFGDAARPIADVATELDVPVVQLRRLARALASLGALTEPRADEFQATEIGALLRADHPESMRAFIDMFTRPTVTRAWEELAYSVRSGTSAFEKLFGQQFFSYLKDHPEESEVFNASMTQETQEVLDILPTAYDFGRYGTVLDIGGGNGTMLAAILRAHPGLRGIVFDSPEGSAQTPERLAALGVADRCTSRAGNFFEAIPGGADLYVIKSVLHDWDDERAELILRRTREVIPADGRLLVIDFVLPGRVDGGVSLSRYLSDLNLMVNTGGRERTLDDFRGLLGRAGFEVTGSALLPGGTGYSYVEARPV